MDVPVDPPIPLTSAPVEVMCSTLLTINGIGCTAVGLETIFQPKPINSLENINPFIFKKLYNPTLLIVSWFGTGPVNKQSLTNPTYIGWAIITPT